MPANVVKGPRDERLWDTAKSQAKKEYPSLSGDKFWAAVNSIFQHMKHRTGSRPYKASCVLGSRHFKVLSAASGFVAMFKDPQLKDFWEHFFTGQVSDGLWENKNSRANDALWQAETVAGNATNVLIDLWGGLKPYLPGGDTIFEVFGDADDEVKKYGGLVNFKKLWTKCMAMARFPRSAKPEEVDLLKKEGLM